jgi:hypothetical protein
LCWVPDPTLLSCKASYAPAGGDFEGRAPAR